MLVLASALLALGSYLQAVNSPFVSDDLVQIRNNATLAALPATELWRLFTKPYNMVDEFLPLRDFSYWLDLKLFGLNPVGFHLHNIFLYLLALPLIYGVTAGLWKYFRPRDEGNAAWVAAAVTALFALHPALVESVVWISGRKYVLPNLFSMLALWLALKVGRERVFSPFHAAMTLLAFVAVMLSKASYVGLAPLIALLWVLFWFDLPQQDRRRGLLLWPAAILLLAAMLLVVFISRSFETQPAHFGPQTILRTLAVLGWLVRLAVSPESRHLFYPVADPYLPGMMLVGAAVLVSAVFAAVQVWRKRSLEGFVLIAFLLLCGPNLQIMPYGAPSLVQDRFLALAAWPVILLVVASAWRLRPLPRAAILLVVAIAWGVQTVERPRDWQSFETIIEVDSRDRPGYYMPAVYEILAFELPQGLYRQAYETAGRIAVPAYRDIMLKLVEADEAINGGEAASGKSRDALALLQHLGPILNKLPEEAKWNSPVQVFWDKCQGSLLRLWMALARQHPDDRQIRYDAGLWMSDAGYYSNAIEQFVALASEHDLPEPLRGDVYRNLGRALLGSGHAAEAEAPLRAATMQSKPDAQAECLLSAVYKLTGRPQEAARLASSCAGH